MGISNITECLTRWLVRKGHFELKLRDFTGIQKNASNALISENSETAKFVPWK